MLKGFASKAYQLIFLWLMKDGPVYGYEVTSRFEKMTKGHIKMSYGTVYPFLRRMEKSGLITSTKDESSGRIYYVLTPKGKLVQKKLASKVDETQELIGGKLLGFLAIYEELFGREALNKLIEEDKLKKQEADSLAYEKLKTKKKEQEKQRLESEKAQLPSLVSQCVEWARAKGSNKKIFQNDIKAFLIEKDLKLLSITEQDLYRMANSKFKSQ